MLKNIRYKIANHYANKALDQIESGEFKEIKKGLKNFKRAIKVAPPSKEFGDIGAKLKHIVTKH